MGIISLSLSEIGDILDRKISAQAIRRELRHTLLRSIDSVAAGRISPAHASQLIMGNRAAFIDAQVRSGIAKRNDDLSRIRQIRGIGAIIAARILDEFGSFSSFARASDKELLAIKGVGQNIVNEIRKANL